MERLPNETLDNAIKVYESTLEATKGMSEDELDDYNPVLDKVIINFLKELKVYRKTGLTPERILAMDEEYTKLARRLGEYNRLEEQGRLIKLPISVENVVDKLFSHNEIVALWYKVKKDVTYHKLVWRGMAWDIPKKFKSCGFVKFFGTIPQNISQADVINIEVLLTEEAEKALAEMGG